MTESTDYTRLDDSALAKRSLADGEAFAALYRRYLHPLYRYLYQRLGNAGDAEDLTAQVFTEMLESLGRYRERGHFAGWLFTIARNRLTDFYRQRAHLPLDDPPDSSPGLHDAIEQKESHVKLGRLLAQLDKDKRELLRLRFAAGLSFADMAAALGRREAAVKMALYRVLDWLREEWHNDHE